VTDTPHVHDPQVLRAIAHPVRNRILTELDAHGSLRAADIARELDIPANQASFHLRQLAKYGLVEEDPAAARDKRDRVWRAVNPGGLTINLKELEESPGGKAASAVYLRNAVAWGQVVVDSALNRRDPETHSSLTEMAVRLTKEEATRLTGELNDVVERWAASTRGGHDDDRRTYLYYGMVLPHPETPAPDA
jgi:predicted ArsR family transcriptional regulator